MAEGGLGVVRLRGELTGRQGLDLNASGGLLMIFPLGCIAGEALWGKNIHTPISHGSQLCVRRFTTSALAGIILHFTAPCDFNSSFRMTTLRIIIPRGASFHCEASIIHRQHSKTVCACCSCLTYACNAKPHAITPYV